MPETPEIPDGDEPPYYGVKRTMTEELAHEAEMRAQMDAEENETIMREHLANFPAMVKEIESLLDARNKAEARKKLNEMSLHVPRLPRGIEQAEAFDIYQNFEGRWRAL